MIVVRSCLLDQSFDRWDYGIACLLIISGFLLLYSTLGDYGLTWDEPFFINHTLKYQNFLESLEQENELSFWRVHQLFDEKETHPPLQRVIALTFILIRPDMPKLPAARTATALTSSLLLAVVYFWARRRLGRPAATLSALSLLLAPRFFAHAHFFACDAAVAFWWTLTFWLFYEGRFSWRYWFLASLAFGGALLTKNTAFFIPIALLGWVIICRYGFRGKRALAYETILDWILKIYLMILVGGLLLWLFWPRFWFDLRNQVLNYITFHLKHDNEGVFYLGKAYSGKENPPWHYPGIMMLTTFHPIQVLLLLTGLGWLFRRRFDTWTILILVSAFFLPLLFTLPGVPVYDGVRLFLSAFPALAVIMGCGFEALFQFMGRLDGFWLSGRRRVLMVWAMVILACLTFLYSVFNIHPYQLSYYNLFAGGLKGASNSGFSVTYWGEVMDDLYPVLNRVLDPGDELILAGIYHNIDYLHTVTDDPMDDHHLRPGFRLLPYKPGVLNEGGSGAPRYLLVVQRKDSIPLEVQRFQQNHRPLYSLEIQGVALAYLYLVEKGIDSEVLEVTRHPFQKSKNDFPRQDFSG